MASGGLYDVNKEPGLHTASEANWVKRFPVLEQHGYRLRPRFTPGWKPSWKTTDKGKDWTDCEDGMHNEWGRIIDATRVSDGTRVCLKTIEVPNHETEIPILQYVSTEPMLSDSKNHCVPLYDTIKDPVGVERQILVMPWLRPSIDPRFDTVGEVLDMVTQLFEGLQWMHNHGIAHRDCCKHNIMMDAAPIYPESWHATQKDWNLSYTGPAKALKRADHPVRYYFIDFGLSEQFDPKIGPPMLLPAEPGDKSVPEFQGKGYNTPHNLLPTDVYLLGNFLRIQFLEGCLNFEVLAPLLLEMTDKDPGRRPTMEAVVRRWDLLQPPISKAQKASKVLYAKDHAFRRFIRNIRRRTF